MKTSTNHSAQLIWVICLKHDGMHWHTERGPLRLRSVHCAQCATSANENDLPEVIGNSMPHWYLKAIPQKLLSVLPGGSLIHEWMQRRVAGSLEITDFLLEDRLAHVARHLDAWKTFGQTENAPTCLEIGTGWYPIVPLGMALCGAKSVYSVDVTLHTNSTNLSRLFEVFIEARKAKKLEQYFPGIQPVRWQTFEDLVSQNTKPESILKALKIHLLQGIEGNLPDFEAPIDLIHSNNTFEHIPVEQIPSLLVAIRNSLKPEGISSHYIDLTDHYSYFDATLSPFNYLRFSASKWTLIENSFQSQNRLRVNQWQNLMNEANLPVIWQDNESGKQDDLRKIKPVAPFAQMDERDLLVRYTHLVSRRRP